MRRGAGGGKMRGGSCPFLGILPTDVPPGVWTADFPRQGRIVGPHGACNTPGVRPVARAARHARMATGTGYDTGWEGRRPRADGRWTGADEEDRGHHQALQARRGEDALHEIGLQGLTVIEAKGFGRQKGHTSSIAARYVVDFLPKVNVEVVCGDDMLERAVAAIQAAARTAASGRQDLRLRHRRGDPHPHRERGEDAV